MCVCVSHILLQISIRIINSDVTSYEYYIIGEEKAIIYNFLQSVKQHGGPTDEVEAALTPLNDRFRMTCHNRPGENT